MSDHEFEAWLAERIDAQTIRPELRRAMRAQYDSENSPPDELVVLADDEVWAAAIREPAL